MAANATPMALAAKSSQSPLRFSVQYSCNNSMIPLITIGAMNAQINSFQKSGFGADGYILSIVR